MRKNMLLAVLLLASSAIFAQLNFGVKAGYTSSLTLDNAFTVANGTYNVNNAKSEMGNGFHAGVFARVGGKIYIQPELLYAMSKKDYQITYQEAVDKKIDFQQHVTVSTVDIPLLLGYKLVDHKMANVRVFAGPKIRLNAGSSLEFDNVTNNTSSITQDQLKSDIMASKVGLEAGVGIDFLMVTLDARYNLIGDMYETKISTLTVNNIPKSTFVISVGWKFF